MFDCRKKGCTVRGREGAEEEKGREGERGVQYVTEAAGNNILLCLSLFYPSVLHTQLQQKQINQPHLPSPTSIPTLNPHGQREVGFPRLSI